MCRTYFIYLRYKTDRKISRSLFRISSVHPATPPSISMSSLKLLYFELDLAMCPVISRTEILLMWMITMQIKISVWKIHRTPNSNLSSVSISLTLLIFYLPWIYAQAQLKDISLFPPSIPNLYIWKIKHIHMEYSGGQQITGTVKGPRITSVLLKVLIPLPH